MFLKIYILYIFICSIQFTTLDKGLRKNIKGKEEKDGKTGKNIN